MAKVSTLGYRRTDWVPVMQVIFGAGYNYADVAKLIRSTPPTVREIGAGMTEPKHSQGVFLLSMAKLIKAGTYPTKDKKNG